MTNQEINKFIDENSAESIIDYSDRLMDKLADITKRKIQLSVYTIGLIFVYYISIKSMIKEFEIGSFKITDLSLIRKITPACLAYLLLEFSVLGRHQGMVMKTLRLISFRRYKMDLTVLDHNPANYNEILRMLFPFSFSIELQHIPKMDKKFGCLCMLMQLPLSVIYLIPILALLIIFYNSIFLYSWDFVSVISMLITLYAIIYMIYFYITIIKYSITENKIDSNNLR